MTNANNTGSKKKKKKWPFIVGGIVLVLVFFAIIGDEDTEYTESVSSSESPVASSDYSSEVSQANDSGYWETPSSNYPYGELSPDLYDVTYPYGLAVKCEGNILVYSLFLNDDYATWDMDGVDAECVSVMNSDLQVATQYISDQAALYDVDVNFIYDWNEYPDLMDQIYMDGVYTTEVSPNWDIGNYLWSNKSSDISALIDKYKPNSLIIMVFNRSDLNNKTGSYTIWTSSTGGMDFEICNIKSYYDGTFEGPGVVAHEMLHTFAVPDTYCVSPAGNDVIITQQYVDYLKSIKSNEIMFYQYDYSTHMPNHEKVTNEIGDLTAYYLSWTDSSPTRDEWGFEAGYRP